jgi:hypothetical protein
MLPSLTREGVMDCSQPGIVNEKIVTNFVVPMIFPITSEAINKPARLKKRISRL